MRQELKVKEKDIKKKYEKMGSDLRSNLESDGMIRKGDRFKLEMKNGKMFVNGKKQSSSDYKKYSRIISRYHDGDFEGDVNFTISQSKQR